jgi:hypothetical protein
MDIEKEIELIKERNGRVEADKAWEVSKTRVLAVLAMTYIITAVVFYLIGVKDYFVNALIPSLGFYLSTQSLPVIKKLWVKKYFKK